MKEKVHSREAKTVIGKIRGYTDTEEKQIFIIFTAFQKEHCNITIQPQPPSSIEIKTN